MFAGHVGAGLAIGAAERRVNIGVFVAAALLLDLLLWLFVLAGWESASIPPDFAATHQPAFAFPYSHSLLAGVVWSFVAAAIYTSLHREVWKLRAALLVAFAVFSHWLLDALVHVPELSLAGPGSTKVGLGLWSYMPVALAVEAAIVVLGLRLFLRAAPLARGRRHAIAALSLLILALTLAGMTVAPAPPSATAMAVTSFATLLLVCALMFWLGKPSRS